MLVSAPALVINLKARVGRADAATTRRQKLDNRCFDVTMASKNGEYGRKGHGKYPNQIIRRERSQWRGYPEREYLLRV